MFPRWQALVCIQLSQGNETLFTAEETRGRRNMHDAMQGMEGLRHALNSVCPRGEMALGWHQDMRWSLGVKLSGRVCGPDSTSLGDGRQGSMAWAK